MPKIFHSIPRFLEIIDRKCCILFGPPRIANREAELEVAIPKVAIIATFYAYKRL